MWGWWEDPKEGSWGALRGAGAFGDEEEEEAAMEGDEGGAGPEDERSLDAPEGECDSARIEAPRTPFLTGPLGTQTMLRLGGRAELEFGVDLAAYRVFLSPSQACTDLHTPGRR